MKKLKTLLLLFPIFAQFSLFAQKPNVIVIMTDDQGYGDLGCHGNPAIRTPNIDLLHEQSVRFTNYHADPTCAPTRAALMTGKYSHRVRVWHTIQGGNAEKGLYEFEVRRWPKEVNAYMRGIPKEAKRVDAWIGTDPVAGLLYKAHFKELPVHFVSIRLNDFQDIKTVNKTDESKIFTFNLEKGDIQLAANFLDEEKKGITTAYYVYIRKSM